MRVFLVLLLAGLVVGIVNGILDVKAGRK